ncbi:50S ribosomal protein L6 [Salinisphaera sp. USBA-960]|uniref:50S ribosomal protein L6 n=1 Tax=Salinisphaera orenii TaxID=856731 RepID=UPI000DBE88EE|nr:50S ribosomal protein L6 [Salifodinibacter halophilus]NNC26677.1 50S ribosomal protein L6 [Salifodinibacter halophilus]
MSRVGGAPVKLPDGVECQVAAGTVTVSKGDTVLSTELPRGVDLSVEAGEATMVSTARRKNAAMMGTARANVQNLVTGVTEGFVRRLQLVGVGYRVQASGNRLSLSLGLSHPAIYEVPDEISVEVPSATEIVLRGTDKQKVGHAAAEIRQFRPPEPYKGKGIRYADEYVIRKDPKKK